MAVDGGLSRSTRRRLLLLAALVIAGHALVLYWFARWQQPRLLRPLTEPMYTRLLQPTQPPPPPAAQARVARPEPTPGRLQAARSVPATSTPTSEVSKASPEPASREPAKKKPPEESERQVEETHPLPESPAPDPDPALATNDPSTETAQAEPPAPAASEAAPAEPQPAPGEPNAETAVAAATPASSSASAPTTSALDTWPADTRLRYRLGGRFRSGELYGNARVLWQREGTRYQVRVEVEITFWAHLVMTSQGEVGPDGLLPHVYEEQRRGKVRGLRMGEQALTLANGTVVPRPAGVQDTASQFVELTHRFATGREALEVGRAVSFWMARPGQVDRWTYDIVEREVLRTQLGDIEAFHLKPRPIANPRGNITAEMWFAPSLQYLPVRIRVSMGDEAQVDLLVESIEQR